MEYKMRRSKKTNITEAHRRQIRKMIVEEITQKKILVEHAQTITKKMYLYESQCNRKGIGQRNINQGLVEIINEGFGCRK